MTNDNEIPFTENNWALLMGAMANAQPNKTLVITRDMLAGFNPEGWLIRMSMCQKTQNMVISLEDTRIRQ